MKVYISILRNNKALSLINLVGLSVGISSCIFISLFLQDEFGYDKYHQNINRIFRVSTRFVSDGSIDHTAISSSPLAEALRRNFPEVEDAVRFITMGAESTVKLDENVYKEKQIYKADAAVFTVFSYTMISGDPTHALTLPHHVVLTQSLAEKYFGSAEPLGRTLTIAQEDYLVSGVIEDLPENSDLRFTMLASMDSTDHSEDWFDFSYYTYILVDEKSSSASDFVSLFEKKLNDFVDDKINGPLRESNQNISAILNLQAMNGMHFDLPLLYDTHKGNKNYSYIFSCVAVLILIIACLNYINFSTVQSIGRSKEVGIRKVMGARFLHLVFRYTGESLLFTFASLILAFIITVLMLPVFNEVTDRHFMVFDLAGSNILLAMLAIVFAVGVVAGSYPAFFMVSITPIAALKGKISTPKGKAMRKISIVVQFFISIGLMICTVIIYEQMAFIKKYELGFRKENIVVVSVPSDSALQQKIQVFKERLLRNTEIKSVALAGLGALPGNDPERGSVVLKTDGKEDARMVNYNYVDEYYLPALDLKLEQGRNFDGRISDFQKSIMVNEALVNMMGWKNPLEQQISWNGEFRNIVGVVRDFHYVSLYTKVEPQVIVYHEKQISTMFVVLSGTDVSDQVLSIKAAWSQLFSYEPFVYKFLDESVSAQYQKEEKAMNVFTYFSVLTVGISCLGLFGLSLLHIYQRKKEIGIRKIIGADFSAILILISREYLLLVLLSLVTVSPLSWWMMHHWLETFPYREEIGISVFISVGAGVMVASLLTILLSISKISISKPVDLVGET